MRNSQIKQKTKRVGIHGNEKNKTKPKNYNENNYRKCY